MSCTTINMKRLTIIFLFFSGSVFAQKKLIIDASGNSNSYPAPLQVSLLANGIVSDADLSLYSTSFGTDQTAAIQAILNTASVTNPLTILWDAKISCTGLRIKSYTTINALPGCGAILRDNSDNWLLSNYNWKANSNVFVDSNIVINGGIWNGDGYRGGVAKQANNTTAKGQITVTNFFGVKNLWFTNSTFLNSSTWCCCFLTIENLYIQNCIINDGTGQKYQDGFNFQGYLKHIRVKDCVITCGDDRLVLCPNSTGGVNGIIDHTAYTGVDGDETDIIFSNISFLNDGKGIAIYSAGGNQVKDVVFENIFGTAQTFWGTIMNQDMLAGYTLTTGSKVPINIVFKNIDVDVKSYTSYGATSYPLFLVSCSAEDLIFQNIKRTDYTLSNETFGVYNAAGGATAVSVKNLTIDGYRSFNTSANSVDQIYVSGATVTNLSVINSRIDLGTTLRTGSFVNIRSGATVTNLTLANDNLNDIKYGLSNAGTITNARINGITHTGQGGADATINTTGTFTTLWMTNWIGSVSTAGTITTKKGDAFL
jgi:hypothetical protein